MVAQFFEGCCRPVYELKCMKQKKKKKSVHLALIHLFLSEKISEITCQSTH